MKGMPGVGNNMKKNKPSMKMETGKDPMPMERCHMSETPMKMNMKEFNRTKDTSCGVER